MSPHPDGDAFMNDTNLPHGDISALDFDLPRASLAIQKGTRVLISLWDSLMFGRVPKNAAPVFGYAPEHQRIP